VRLRAARRPAEGPGEPGRREHIGEAESRGHLDALLQPLQERAAVPDPVAHHGAHDDVGDVRGKEGAHVHGLGRRGLRQRRDEAGGLGLAPPPEGLDPPRAEQLGDAQLAELAPAVAVRGERDAEAVPSELPDGGGRVANAASWVLMAASGDDATTTGSSPKSSSMSGPC
jgi:hypothetical protein